MPAPSELVSGEQGRQHHLPRTPGVCSQALPRPAGWLPAGPPALCALVSSCKGGMVAQPPPQCGREEELG